MKKSCFQVVVLSGWFYTWNRAGINPIQINSILKSIFELVIIECTILGTNCVFFRPEKRTEPWTVLFWPLPLQKNDIFLWPLVCINANTHHLYHWHVVQIIRMDSHRSRMWTKCEKVKMNRKNSITEWELTFVKTRSFVYLLRRSIFLPMGHCDVVIMQR